MGVRTSAYKEERVKSQRLKKIQPFLYLFLFNRRLIHFYQVIILINASIPVVNANKFTYLITQELTWRWNNKRRYENVDGMVD